MDDVGFLEQHGATGFSMPATLMVLLPDGSVTHISDINHFKLLDECPLLFHAFEFRESGQVQQANIEVRGHQSRPASAHCWQGYITHRCRLTAPIPVHWCISH